MKACEPLIISSESGYNLRIHGNEPIARAWNMIARDHKHVFGQEPRQTEKEPSIVIRYTQEGDDCPDWPEGYCLRFVAGSKGTILHIIGNDELGIIYGLLHYSRYALGVEPFWFWAELLPPQQDTIVWPSQNYDSPQPKVRYRGWFVNDEVCLIGWKDEYPPTEQVWQPVFEALLRCGGNMVIPGTDLPRTGIHHKLAAEMGLWLTHHHAEPLGAEMFLRAFPGKQASYREHPELFEQLWQEAIERQKGEQLVWVLSFRGQGDKPFWEDDPSINTPDKRGQLISYVVRKQYNMICECVEHPVCCMAMYGEIAELYKQGYIEVPAGVIKVWADNGYGKMVSRRHGNLNHRIPALPEAEDGGKNGVYYHVTFHDLQASNHLTQFPSSVSLIVDELTAAFTTGADEYLLVNSGNILPHVYTLDLVANVWTNGEVDAEAQLTDFVARLYSCQHQEISQLYRDYSRCTIEYGPHKDDRAGEEFYHHPARQMMGFWLQGKAGHDERLCWATGEKPFAEQVSWFKQKAESAIPGWAELRERCLQIMKHLSEDENRRLYNQLLVQIELHLSGSRGLARLCLAYGLFLEKEYARAFIQASHAVWSFQMGKEALSLAETGRWEHFYRADWLTNLDNTISHADTVRRFLRLQGDSPDMFLWSKQYLMPETEKYIYLENTHRKPLPDDELARCLEKVLY